MQYTIEADAEFLRVRVSGRDTDRPPPEVCAAVLDASVQHERNRILIELDQLFPLSPASQHTLITRLPELGLTHRQSIALVHRTPTAQMANEFINVIAENRDLHVRNCSSVEEAAAWLRSRPA